MTAASSGDQIWVAAGTYTPADDTERIIVKAGVKLYGGFVGNETTAEQRDARNWKANVTILDGRLVSASSTWYACVVEVNQNAARDTLIEGFTIKNGRGTDQLGSLVGGGIHCQGDTVHDYPGASPTIRYNTIVDNDLQSGSNPQGGWGGGIYCYNSEALIEDNTIALNTGALGTAIYCKNGTSERKVVIRRNRVVGNRCDTYQGGGAIYCEDCSPEISNNTIVANYGCDAVGVDGNYCGGIYCVRALPIIANNVIIGNTAVSHGGGIYCDASSPIICNNTIVGNAEFSHDMVAGLYVVAPRGGGIACEVGSSPQIVNNIIAFGSSGIYCDATSVPTLTKNCVYGNADGDYNGIAPGTTDISQDPRLWDLKFGDMRIHPTSPCRDTGDNATVDGIQLEDGWSDIEGQARKQGTVDIGADESDRTYEVIAPRVIRVATDGSDANDGSSWTSAKQTIQAAIRDIALQGGAEIWVKADTYGEFIRPLAYSYLYGGFCGAETTRSARNWTTNVTTLDGTGLDACMVTIDGGYSWVAVDGFTIRDGGAIGDVLTAGTVGGGIKLFNSAATIANNVIADNESECGGGGLWCRWSCPVIINNVITGNYGSSGGLGGGGALIWDSRAVLAYNIISENHVFYSAGGVYCDDSRVMLKGNTISGNETDHFASFGGVEEAGGIHLDYCSGTVSGNQVQSNLGNGGGGIMSVGPAVLSGNTIQSNRAYIWVNGVQRTRNGGGIYVLNGEGETAPLVVDNTISGNFTSDPLDYLTGDCNGDSHGGGIYIGHDSGAVIVDNDILSNLRWGIHAEPGLWPYVYTYDRTRTIVPDTRNNISGNAIGQWNWPYDDQDCETTDSPTGTAIVGGLPASPTITINDNDDYTNSREVILNICSMANAAAMKFSNDSGTTWSNYEEYASTTNWTLSAGDGWKTVSPRFMDKRGATPTDGVSDGILLDTVAPNPGTLWVPTKANADKIIVSYSGASDDSQASGLKQVELWYKKNSGKWTYWGCQGTSSGWFTFEMQGEGWYYFDLVAEDNAGNRSAAASDNGDGSTEYDTTFTLRYLIERADNTTFAYGPLVVTAEFSSPQRIYAETEDRTCGIQVRTSQSGFTLGDRVNVTGTLAQDGGERYMTSAGDMTAVSGDMVAPLGMRNEWLGGWAPTTYLPTLKDGFGFYNVGLLVQSWGKVTYVGTDHFYISDGSDLSDGSGHWGVRVQMTPPTGVDTTKYVRVTGISGAMAIEPNYVRILRPRSADDDIEIFSQQSFSDTTASVAVGTNMLTLPGIPWNCSPEYVFVGCTPGPGISLDGYLKRFKALQQQWDTYSAGGHNYYNVFNCLMAEGYQLTIPTGGNTCYHYLSIPVTSDGTEYPRADQLISVPLGSSAGTFYSLVGNPLDADISWSSIQITDGKTIESLNGSAWLDEVQKFTPGQGWSVITDMSTADMEDGKAYKIYLKAPRLALIIPAP